MTKSVKAITRELAKYGWRNPRPVMWLCPCGQHKVTIHLTHSDKRAINNLKRDIGKCKEHSPNFSGCGRKGNR